jgi:hypothetical protein
MLSKVALCDSERLTFPYFSSQSKKQFSASRGGNDLQLHNSLAIAVILGEEQELKNRQVHTENSKNFIGINFKNKKTDTVGIGFSYK